MLNNIVNIEQFWQQIQGCRKIDNWGGGAIFIYSCSAQLISFEIVILSQLFLQSVNTNI